MLKYYKKKPFAELLREQWIVFRWGVVIIMFISVIVSGYYGSGFNSAQFIYLQF